MYRYIHCIAFFTMCKNDLGVYIWVCKIFTAIKSHILNLQLFLKKEPLMISCYLRGRKCWWGVQWTVWEKKWFIWVLLNTNLKDLSWVLQISCHWCYGHIVLFIKQICAYWNWIGQTYMNLYILWFSRMQSAIEEWCLSTLLLTICIKSSIGEAVDYI